jgi:hypothetical protein
MTSRTRRFLVLAALVWIAAPEAEAVTFANANCLQVLLSQPVWAQCSQTQVQGSAPGVEIRGIGEALADLRTGTLKARSVGQAYQTGSEDLYAAGGATAEFRDTITVGGGFTGTVGLRMEVSGSFLMSDPSFPSNSPLLGALLEMWNVSDPNGTNSEARLFVVQYTQPFDVFIRGAATVGTGTLSTNVDAATGRFADLADIRVVLTTTVAVTPSNPTFSFFARIFTSAGVHPLADTNGEIKTSELNFGNSAYVSLTIPAGVPWTSESGAFLQAVPEPGTGALVVAAMLGLAGVRRPSPLRRASPATARAAAKASACASHGASS